MILSDFQLLGNNKLNKPKQISTFFKKEKNSDTYIHLTEYHTAVKNMT